MKKFLFFWLPVIIYAALIYYISSKPDLPKSVSIPHIDKAVHFIEYAILSFLLARALKQTAKLNINFRLIAVIVAILYGFSDEWHQLYVPGRSMDGIDLIFDGMGATIVQFLLR